ncbi:MAG: hypothetical protein ACE5H3_07855, partial [Planctomycetota bacterium]
AAVVLVWWGISALGGGGGEAGGEGSGRPVPRQNPRVPPPVPPAPPILEEGSPEDASPGVSRLERDPRWEKARSLAREGLDQMARTRKWQEETGGDPFRYRSEMRAAQELLQESMGLLRQLQEAHAGEPDAMRRIQAERRRLEKPLAGLFKES